MTKKKHEPVTVTGEIQVEERELIGHPIEMKIRRKMNLKKGAFAAETGPQKRTELPGIPKTRVLG